MHRVHKGFQGNFLRVSTLMKHFITSTCFIAAAGLGRTFPSGFYEARPLATRPTRCPGESVVCGIRAAVDDFLGGVRRIILACCHNE